MNATCSRRGGRLFILVLPPVQRTGCNEFLEITQIEFFPQNQGPQRSWSVSVSSGDPHSCHPLTFPAHSPPSPHKLMVFTWPFTLVHSADGKSAMLFSCSCSHDNHDLLC